VTWRISDALWAVLAGLVAGAVAFAVVGTTDPSPLQIFAIILPAQQLGMLGTFIAASRRRIAHPIRELQAVPKLSDLPFLAVGLGLAVVATLAISVLIDIDDTPQEIARIAEDSEGAAVWFAWISTVALAPLVEEVVFRGGLLRALQRSLPFLGAAAVSAAAWAAIHYEGGNSIVVLPVLFVLGLILAAVARSGGVGRAILVHSGFNLLAALALLAQ